jgi:hypothetical protein
MLSGGGGGGGVVVGVRKPKPPSFIPNPLYWDFEYDINTENYGLGQTVMKDFQEVACLLLANQKDRSYRCTITIEEQQQQQA